MKLVLYGTVKVKLSAMLNRLRMESALESKFIPNFIPNQY